MPVMLRFALLLLAGLSLMARAEVYTYIDAEGNRVFTDQPRGGDARRIELAPTNQVQFQQPAPAAPVAQPAPAAPAYQLLRILVPEPDAVIRDVTGNLIVSVSSEPNLLPGHSYRLLLDGQPVGNPGSSPVFPLENLDRGTHQLAVEIIDQHGLIVERTANQPVHIKRISLNEKRQTNPCKKGDYGVRPECPLRDKPAEKADIPLIPFI